MKTKWNIFGILVAMGLMFIICVCCSDDGEVVEHFSQKVLYGDESIRIENYNNSPINVTIYGSMLITRAVGDEQIYSVRLDDQEGNEGLFYMKIRQISQTQTETIHYDSDNQPIASFVCENEKISHVQILNENNISLTRGPRLQACMTVNYVSIQILISESGAGWIANANNTGAMLPITEIQIGIASAINCFKRGILW